MPQVLADYAVGPDNSRGRTYKEQPHPYRSDFERDRDRIIHSEAFRRLEGKMQVFTTGLNDNYRNRLTHSIEVAQMGRTIAKALNLNEPLTEAICLAHDLGHSPFGHTGEAVLNEIMAEFGGFEHNRQTLRIVDFLEHPYPDFAGLNLMYETRLGLAIHKGPYDKPTDDVFGEKNCSLEGQIAEVADRIAYNSHDLEDGMRSRVIEAEQLANVELFTIAQQRIKAETVDDMTIRRIRTAKAIIDVLVSDCIETSSEAIRSAGIKGLNDIYERQDNLIVLSQAIGTSLARLEKFLMQNLYQHNSVRAENKVRQWLSGLFDRLCSKPDIMPGYYQGLIDQQGLQRVVCDYIAGMTDRYCLRMLDELSL
jgi:dGTPase